jgi:glycosyltransferase involved in cell wall biosynthesis
MRIAVWHNLPSGGGKRALYDHVRGLVSRGHHVEAWCPSTADPDFLPLADLCPEHVLPWAVKPPRPWLLARHRAEPLAVAARLAAMDDHCRQAAAEIAGGRFDVLFANCCQFFRATPIGRHTPLPGVLYLQEPYRWLYEAMPRPPFLGPPPAGRSVLAPWYLRQRLADFFPTEAKRAMIRAEVDSAAGFRRLLVNSYFSRESVLRAYGLDSTVCYLGVDADRFAGPDRPRADQVVGVGAYVPEKNIELVIRAVGRVAAPRPRLVWVGNAGTDEYVAQLGRLAAECGVEFVPHRRVPDAEVTELLRTSLAMVYAPRLEPFGYAPLEANACGTPVVAVAEGGVRETVTDGVNGLVVAPEPGAMAAAIESLRADPRLAARLGAAGWERVRTVWSLDAAIDRLESHLLAVAGGGA